MPTVRASAQRPKATRRMVLVWLTLAIALVHLALLMGIPDAMVVFQGEDAPSARSLATRTILPEPPVAPAPAAVSTAAPTPKLPRSRPIAAQPAPPSDPPPDPVADSIPAPSVNNPGLVPDTAPTTTETPGDTIATENAATAPAASVSAPMNTDPTNTGSTLADAQPPRKLVLPPSVRLLYDVNGVVTYAYTGGSELLWINQGTSYNARLQITKFGFNLRTWTSKGTLGEQGLEPSRFGDRTRSEIAAHFQREKGLISFSANSPDVPLLPGTQDYLSSFFQLAGMLAGEPERYPAGSKIAFQVVSARDAAPWVFKVDGPETFDLPDGPRSGIKLTREHDALYDTKVELWLAPELTYVPIRIRLSQDNGNFAELLWRSAQKPE